MLRERYPYYVGSVPVEAGAELVVTNKYTGQPATRVARADRAAVERAIAAARMLGRRARLNVAVLST
jgi:acyl-CoA reductase-like NAD-dependent aldehyde dehydrogenase